MRSMDNFSLVLESDKLDDLGSALDILFRDVDGRGPTHYAEVKRPGGNPSITLYWYLGGGETHQAFPFPLDRAETEVFLRGWLRRHPPSRDTYMDIDGSVDSDGFLLAARCAFNEMLTLTPAWSLHGK